MNEINIPIGLQRSLLFSIEEFDWWEYLKLPVYPQTSQIHRVVNNSIFTHNLCVQNIMDYPCLKMRVKQLGSKKYELIIFTSVLS